MVFGCWFWNPSFSPIPFKHKNQANAGVKASKVLYGFQTFATIQPTYIYFRWLDIKHGCCVIDTS